MARMTGVTCALLETRLPKMLNTSVLEKEVKKKGNNEFVIAAKRVCPCVVGLLKMNDLLTCRCSIRQQRIPPHCGDLVSFFIFSKVFFFSLLLHAH